MPSNKALSNMPLNNKALSNMLLSSKALSNMLLNKALSKVLSNMLLNNKVLSHMLLNNGTATPRNAILDSGTPLRLSSVTPADRASMMASRQHASTLRTAVEWIREMRVCSGILPYGANSATIIAKASSRAIT